MIIGIGHEHSKEVEVENCMVLTKILDHKAYALVVEIDNVFRAEHFQTEFLFLFLNLLVKVNMFIVDNLLGNNYAVICHKTDLPCI